MLRQDRKREALPGTVPLAAEFSEHQSALQKLFEEQSGAGKKSKVSAKTKEQSGSIPMLSNVISNKGLDRTLIWSCGYGLKGFATDLKPLTKEQERYFKTRGEIDAEFTTDGELFRACIKEGDKRWFEIPREPRRTLHTISDCASTNLTGALWTHTRGGVHGTHSSDVFAHDANNSVKRSLVAAGLWLLVLEWTLVANWTKAQFSSDGFWEQIRTTAFNLFAFIEASDFSHALWELFYERIARALGMWDPDQAWTKAHQKKVLSRCKDLFRYRGKTVALCRWFSV